MKIALVTLGFKPFRTAGFDIAGEHFVRALLEAGHCVTVIAGKKEQISETETHPNLQIYRIQLDRFDWFSFSIRAAQLLHTLGFFDVIHFYDISFSYAYRGNYVASLQHSFRQRLKSLGAFRWQSGARWLFYYLYYSLAFHLAEKPGIRKAQGFLASSSTTRKEYIENYGINPDKAAQVKHSIDADFFNQTSLKKHRCLRSRLQIGEGEKVILFAGFITPRKGLEFLARALPAIEPLPKLVIVGKWRNPGYRQDVLRLLQPVIGQVIEAGFVPDEEMPDYYSLADVYVSASLMEGFGLPLGEALACETPVVAFDAGATAEVVGPGGILVPPRDVDGLAKAVSRLLQTPELCDAMGKAGRQHILNEFSVETMLKATLEAYERFLGAKG